ncbi:hypothetical protein V8C42DRAFT_357705 [Trichoderma barbatum]
MFSNSNLIPRTLLAAMASSWPTQRMVLYTILILSQGTELVDCGNLTSDKHHLPSILVVDAVLSFPCEHEGRDLYNVLSTISLRLIPRNHTARLEAYRHCHQQKHAHQHGAAKPTLKRTLTVRQSGTRPPMTWLLLTLLQTSATCGVNIDILKRLTADPLEIFRQVSHHWHNFLGLDKPPSSALLLLSLKGSLKWKGQVSTESQASSKRPKVKSLDKPGIKSGEDQLILRALQAALRNEAAQFQTPQQEEAIVNMANSRRAIDVRIPFINGIDANGKTTTS